MLHHHRSQEPSRISPKNCGLRADVEGSAKLFRMMVARDGVEWNYVPLDGLTLYPNLLNTEHPAA